MLKVYNDVKEPPDIQKAIILAIQGFVKFLLYHKLTMAYLPL